MSGEEEEEEKVSKVQCRHAPKVRSEKKEGFCKVSKVKSLVSVSSEQSLKSVTVTTWSRREEGLNYAKNFQQCRLTTRLGD